MSRKFLTLGQFIERANILHNNLYDYSKTIYTNTNSKVKIICPTHGEFEQRASGHLTGQGCKQCGYSKNRDYTLRISHNKLSLQNFINTAKSIHGHKYDYSLVEYINNKTNIDIICQNHGLFKQRPDTHLSGYGCKKCKTSIGETKIRAFLNLHNIEFEEQKTFEDCKNKIKLRFDFYIPVLNLCIEFQGSQHYKPYSFGSNKSKEDLINNLLDTQKRDKIKKDYCTNKLVNLLIIPYWQIKEIDQLLVNLAIQPCTNNGSKK